MTTEEDKESSSPEFDYVLTFDDNVEESDSFEHKQPPSPVIINDDDDDELDKMKNDEENNYWQCESCLYAENLCTEYKCKMCLVSKNKIEIISEKNEEKISIKSTKIVPNKINNVELSDSTSDSSSDSSSDSDSYQEIAKKSKKQIKTKKVQKTNMKPKENIYSRKGAKNKPNKPYQYKVGDITKGTINKAADVTNKFSDTVTNYKFGDVTKGALSKFGW